MSSRLAAFLRPGSVALVGCPGDLSRPGARPLVYLQKHGYRGRIYPVNPNRREIGGLAAYPSLQALPEPPDLVWIGVPGPEVERALEDAAGLGVRQAVILTAGFAETDAEGRERQGRLASIARRADMTVLGPNMLGFINCWDRVPLTFSPAGGLDVLVPGGLGVASQSGALGGIVVNRAFDRGIGVSAMISTGNELGITVSECLEYFAEDSHTRAAVLLAEGIRDGARLRTAAAAMLAARKPVVAMKMGRSTTGQRNALTHTGALAGSHEAWQAVARQLGIIEADSLEDLVEVAGFLSREPRATPRGVAVVASSGGASIMMADQLAARGVPMPRLGKGTVAGLAALLPEYARTRDNPVDVTAGLSEDLFARVLETLVAEPGVDGVVAIVTGARGVERAENLARIAKEAAKPVVPCWLGGSVTEDGLQRLDSLGVPCFRSPRTLALALAAARDFERAARLGPGRAGEGRPVRATARPVTGPVPYAVLAEHARRVGVPRPPERLVRRAEEAVTAARKLGFPVVLKAMTSGLAHKTERGAVVLGLGDGAAVRSAARGLLRRLGRARLEGLLVQRMAEGVEVLVGVTCDATFGPMLVVGAGGVQAELLGDTACRPLPVTPREIRAMLGEVRSLRALGGYRGAPPADVPALLRAIAAVARLAGSFGAALVALDANPVIVGPRGSGAVAVDLRVQLHAKRSAEAVPAAGRTRAAARPAGKARSIRGLPGVPPVAGGLHRQGR